MNFIARVAAFTYRSHRSLDRFPRFGELLFFGVHTLSNAGRRSRNATRIPSKHVYCVYRRELAALTVHAAWHSSADMHSRNATRYATWLHFRSLGSPYSSARDVESPFDSRLLEDYRIARINSEANGSLLRKHRCEDSGNLDVSGKLSAFSRLVFQDSIDSTSLS